jgi:hypothetical protein
MFKCLSTIGPQQPQTLGKHAQNLVEILLSGSDDLGFVRLGKPLLSCILQSI